jgi:chromosome segregation ATPase
MEIELEDILSRLEWLEREHRKDHALIADLHQQIGGYETQFDLLQKQINEVSTSLTGFNAISPRLDQFEKVITQYRAEVKKSIEEVEKSRETRDRDMETRRRTEIENINKALFDLRKTLEVLDELKKGIKARESESSRLERSIIEIDKRLKEFPIADEEIRRSVRMVDEARKQDFKRMADLQGEMIAVRKRSDEARERVDINADSIRMLDTRINEVLSSEADRRRAQLDFIEKQNLAQVDRERQWRDWQARFEAFVRQTSSLDAQLAQLEDTQRAVKRSQDAFDDINARLERRIKEITEVQRLAEDRFRQEWVTFKSDDQKRWTNYTLTYDETQKDLRTDIDKVNQRVADVDDLIQSLQDTFQQVNDVNETQLQEIMNWTSEWLTGYERVLGRSRPSR